MGTSNLAMTMDHQPRPLKHLQLVVVVVVESPQRTYIPITYMENKEMLRVLVWCGILITDI